MTETQAVLQPVDTDAIKLAKTLIRTARYGALAVIDPASGGPLASRVGVSSDIDGVPVILISRLAAHTAALLADGRCSLLLGEPGKGDPLAHARISIEARAVEIERGTPDEERIKARYLRHQPKAKLYASLGDFRFFRLEPQRASLNGGFGRAYALSADDIRSDHAANAELAAAEAGAVEHMNEDHSDAVERYARFFAKAPAGRWTLVGIDAEGFEITDGSDMRRIFFEAPLTSAHDMHMVLVRMAQAARTGLAAE